MDAIEFITHYPKYLSIIEKVIKDEYKPVLEHMKNDLDPHDLITPDAYFMNESAALGFVFYLFNKEVKKKA